MNVAIESLLEDAKKLVKHLKNHEIAADTLAGEAKALTEVMESHNVYQDNMADSKIMSNMRSKYLPALTGLQQENCAINSLRKENTHLQNVLTEHQHVLELIMTKYRYEMLKCVINEDWYAKNLKEIQELNESGLAHDQVENMNDKIIEMTAVMQKVVALDESNTPSAQKAEIERLKQENNRIRKALMISQSSFDQSQSADEESKNTESIKNSHNM